MLPLLLPPKLREGALCERVLPKLDEREEKLRVLGLPKVLCERLDDLLLSGVKVRLGDEVDLLPPNVRLFDSGRVTVVRVLLSRVEPNDLVRFCCWLYISLLLMVRVPALLPNERVRLCWMLLLRMPPLPKVRLLWLEIRWPRPYSLRSNPSRIPT